MKLVEPRAQLDGWKRAWRRSDINLWTCLQKYEIRLTNIQRNWENIMSTY